MEKIGKANGENCQNCQNCQHYSIENGFKTTIYHQYACKDKPENQTAVTDLFDHNGWCSGWKKSITVEEVK